MFDYIVVGGGSAGCVLASRLSEDAGVRVLLLEAGGADRHPFIHIPAAFSRLFKTAVDWQLSTEPQTHLHQRRLYWPRGKVLGGSSSINAMIYVRGHLQDYDEWQAMGNDGWGFADVLPYFKKCENQERGASAYHGVGGPLNVADLAAPNPLSQAYLQACTQVGLPRNEDFNGPHQEGVGLNQVNQKAGRRVSAAGPFRGAERLPGPHIVTEEELIADIRNRLETLYHPAGTCKMGQDALSVVNPRLQVHGVRGLRVVDASIMPALVGGNTNAPVVMIAEKAVDLMLDRSPPRREAIARVAADNLS
ncbi:MAG: GMC family oxidoreductase, partial [Gemmataceae bacterium]